MGVGILYRYTHHMLVEQHNCVSTEAEKELISSIESKSIEEQIDAIIKSDLPAFQYINDEEDFADKLMFDIDEDESVNYEAFLDEYVQEESGAVAANVRHHVNSLATAIAKEMKEKATFYRKDDLYHDFSLVKEGEITINTEFDDVEIGFGMFHDNSLGVMVYLENSETIEAQPELSDIKMMITNSLSGFSFIDNLCNKNYKPDDDIESVRENLNEMFRYWSEDQLSALFEDDVAKLSEIDDILDDSYDDDGFISLSKDKESEYIEFYGNCIKLAIQRITKEAERVEAEYNNFAYKLFNNLIESHNDGMFFHHAGNAWVSHSYTSESPYYKED